MPVLPVGDDAIDSSIARMSRRSFIRDGVNPEVQSLLMLPPSEAKAAFLATISQFSLINMLLLASMLGTALDPLKPDAYPETPKLVAAFNFLAALITCTCMYGTSIFFLEAYVIEPLSDERIHTVVARADRVMTVGSVLSAVGLNLTGPLVLIRMWIGGLERVQCIALTAVVGVAWAIHMDAFYEHLQDVLPFNSQLWTKLFWPLRYKKDSSHAAVDEMVGELQRLHRRTSGDEKTLSTKQLAAALDKYLAEIGHDVQHVVEADFIAALEQDCHGRLAPITGQLARTALAKVVDAEVDKIANEALASIDGARN